MEGSHMTRVILTILLHSGYNNVVADTNCPTDSDCFSTEQFKLSTQVIGNDIEVTWTFNESINIYGFKPMIYSTNRDIVYESPMLHYSQRSMSISHELDGENNICIHVYTNSTHILSEQCESVKVADYKVIIGILAGVIFLIPCLVGLSYVIYHDYRKTKEAAYEHIDIDAEAEEEPIEINPKKKISVTTASVKGEEIILKVTLSDSEICKKQGATNAAYEHDDMEQPEQTEHKLTNRKVDFGREVDQEDVDSSNRHTEAKLNIENEIDNRDNSAEEKDAEKEILNAHESENDLNAKKQVGENLSTKQENEECLSANKQVKESLRENKLDAESSHL